MSDPISSLRLSVQGPFLSQSLSLGSVRVFREVQQPSRVIQLCSESFSTEIQGPSYIFGESTPFAQFIFDYRYGPY